MHPLLAEARSFDDLVAAWLSIPRAGRPELDEVVRRARPLLAAKRTRDLGRWVSLALRRAAKRRAQMEGR